MESKKIALAVVLILAAVAAVVITVTRFKAADRPEVPKEYLDQPLEMIDRETFEDMTLSTGEWQKLGHDEWLHYKNPKSGQYTMVGVIPCPNCGAKLPRPDRLTIAGKTPPPAPRVCPKCGKPF